MCLEKKHDIFLFSLRRIERGDKACLKPKAFAIVSTL